MWGIDIGKVHVALGSVRWALFVPVIASYLVTHAVRVWRFKLLVGADVSYRRMFAICALGFMAINVVPFRLGEFLRPYLLSRDGVPLGQGLGAVVLERLLDMAMLLGLLVLVAFGLDLPEGRIVVGGVDVVRAGQQAAATVLVVGALGLAGLVVVGKPAVVLIERIPGVGGTAGRLIAGVAGAAGELAQRPVRGVLAVLASVLTWSLTIGSVWLVLQAFDGLPVSWTAAVVVWTVTIAGMAALPTPGFFGPYEAFCLAALLLWQVDSDVARTFAVVLHLSHFSVTVGLGVPFLLAEGRSLGDLVRESRAG
jgi:hypothetical protein